MLASLIALGIAVVGFLLLGLAGPMYRIGVPLQTSFALLRWGAYLGLGAAAVALVAGLWAYRQKRPRALGLAVMALVVGLIAAGIPYTWQQRARSVPPIHDITTDLENPPSFEAIVPLRAFTLFTSAESLEEFLGKESASLRKKLDALRDKDEWTLRIEFDPETWSDALIRRVDSLRALRGLHLDAELAERGVALGIRRLRVVDLATGDQPQANEDGTCDIFTGGRKLRVFRDGRLVLRATAGIGAHGTPTPRGSYYVNQRFRVIDSWGPFGPAAIGISAFSPVLQEWAQGGPIAIHGTNDPSSVGRAASHGCSRPALKS